MMIIVMMIRISRKVQYVVLVGFYFIFVTHDLIVIYVHENIRIKQLLLSVVFL